MQLMYFTEQPMSAYPAQDGPRFRRTALMFSNKYFDPVPAAASITNTSSITSMPKRWASTASC